MQENGTHPLVARSPARVSSIVDAAGSSSEKNPVRIFTGHCPLPFAGFANTKTPSSSVR
jgi:hypothetical protein